MNDRQERPAGEARVSRRRAAALLGVLVLSLGVAVIAVNSTCGSPWQVAGSALLAAAASGLVAWEVRGRRGELREARREAEAERRHHATLLQHLPDAVIAVDTSFRVTDWSPAAERLFGWRRDEVLGKATTEIFGDLGAAEAAEVQRVAMERSGGAGVARLPRKDGGTLSIAFHVGMLLDDAGQRAGHVAVLRDVTADQVMHAALRHREERYRSVVGAISEGLVFYRSDGALLASNTAAQEIFGVDFQRLVGVDSGARGEGFLGAGGRPLQLGDLPGPRAARSGKAQRGELLGFDRSDGTRAWLSANAEPIGDTSPHPVVMTFTDVTEKLRKEEALRDALASEQRFLATMSHEIRTPLFGILGFLDLLAPAELPPPRRGARGRARRLRQRLTMKKLGVRLLAALLCIAWLTCTPFGARAAPRATRHVLVLNAYDLTYQWTASIIAGVRAELEGMEDVELSIAFMDTKKVYTPAYSAALAAAYAQRYAKIRFDLILSTDDDALDFLLDYRDELFPGVPVVFCGVNDYREGRLRGRTGFTGVNEQYDLDRSLGLIAAQLPATRRIVLLADKSATGVAIQAALARRRPAWDERFAFTTLTHVTKAELAAELRALPPDAVVLWGVFMRDEAGVPLSLSASLRLVVESSPVPVYGFMDVAVSEGVVGGFVVSGDAQGRTAARLGRRILAGERVEAIDVVRDSPNVYMFDHQALRRFHIEATPPGSIVSNRPSSFYAEHRSYVWSTLGGMGIEAAVIAGMIALMRARGRRARASLQESEARYRSVVNAMSEGLVHAASDGAVLTCNPAAVRITGLPREDLAAWHTVVADGGILRADGTPFPRDELPGTRVARTGAAERGVVVGFPRAGGGLVWLSVNADPLGESAPHPVVLTFTDITEQRRREEELRAARAVEARFLATMSHEIRTPLFGLLGFLDLLAAARLDPAHRGWIDDAQVCGRHLLALVNDILDVSKLDAGEVELARETFDLEELLSDCVAIVGTRKRPDVVLRCAVDATSHLLVGDPTRVRQIVLNLLGNAAKFTERGSIELRAAVRPGDGDRVGVAIDVADTGVGIPEGAVGGLFQQFRQAHGSRYGGTGMGLYLSRALAHLMDGDVRVASVEGQGSCFHVELTLHAGPPKAERAPARRAQAAAPRAVETAVAAMRVLMVDDVPMNLKVTRELFRTCFRSTLDTAENGLEAVRMVQAATYDLVLMDLQMPVMDGIEATRRIRALGVGVPIVAMTASALKTEVQQALDAGMNGVLTKPARRADLERVLVAHAARGASGARPPAEPPSGAPPPLAPSPRAAARTHFTELVGPEAADELLRASVESVTQAVAGLRRARAAADARLLGRELHKIKGVLLNCGMNELAAQTAALEAGCQASLRPSFRPRAEALEGALDAFVRG